MQTRISRILFIVLVLVALVALAIAAAAFAGLIPPKIAALQATVQPGTNGGLAQRVPTLRPIWPAQDSTAAPRKRTPTVRPTRTPTRPAATTALSVPSTSLPAEPGFAQSPLLPTPAVAPEQLAVAQVGPDTPIPFTVNATSTVNIAAVAPTSFVTAVPAATQAGSEPLIVTLTPVPQVQATTASAPAGDPTQTPTSTPTSTPTKVPTATPTNTATATSVPAGRITGRVTIDGHLPSQPLTLTLETQTSITDTQTYTTIAYAEVISATGEYTFTNVADSADGYNVVFAQQHNPNNPALQIDVVATWLWVGPIVVTGGANLSVPEFDLALPADWMIQPARNARFKHNVLTANPIQFAWNAYPEATDYWLDVARDADLRVIWQQDLRLAREGSWKGEQKDDTAPAPVGDYWWSVGAQRRLEPYTLTVYSYLTKFSLDP